LNRPDVAALDLDAESRRALEFDELLEWVAGFARTALGAARVRSIAPVCDESQIRDALAAVSETGRFVEAEGMLLGGSLPDPSSAVEALGVGGLRLEPAMLRDLAATGVAGVDLRARLLDLERPQDYPLLVRLTEELPDLEWICRPVLEGIAADGRLEDAASPELRRIRAAKARLGARLQRMLTEILRNPDLEPVIQDDFITERNGRYVVPVRTDAPRPLEGVVHASSSSGATRFIEPLASVELNNELVRLAEEEQQEIERVLAAWSDDFRSRLPEVRDLIGALTRVDDLQARALFAREAKAVPAELRSETGLRLECMRHPLLQRRLVERGHECVPLSLSLDPSQRALVISGPNTGGKTVALKTIGLAVLMTQAGLPVPAEELVLPVFRQVRADIGDHQSIEADLSTYSAHVGAVADYLGSTRPPALFLFDEIGTGTEPTEGAALARAVLESLQRPGITSVATTHLGPLKTWAVAREGVACAAMEFDLASLRPTFRALMGVAGTSAGLDIARRLGLAPEIVDRARALLDPQSKQGESYLVRLRELVMQAEEERETLRRLRDEIAAERRRDEERARTQAAKSRKEASAKLEAALAELREEGRRELGALRDRKERTRLERRWLKSESKLHATMAQQRSELAGDPDEGSWTPLEGAPAAGMRVRVASLGKLGEVVEVRGAQVEVRLGGFSVRVQTSDLQQPQGGPQESPRPSAGGGAGGFASSTPPASRELKLIGKRVEEAVAELDRFLDAALVAGHEEVRIVHGHGTGRLRSAVRRFLESHPQVARSRPGGPAEGGDGATVAVLR
jgi:DNA mismatch repair protein MutS2